MVSTDDDEEAPNPIDWDVIGATDSDMHEMDVRFVTKWFTAWPNDGASTLQEGFTATTTIRTVARWLQGEGDVIECLDNDAITYGY
eukprot:COSAG01_NODE_5006_length_4548_cov_14.793437_6_plen_86_part_00